MMRRPDRRSIVLLGATKRSAPLSSDFHGFTDDLEWGHHLGKVGGHLIAEVLVGLMLCDHTSYLVQDPRWRPELEAGKSGFDAEAPLSTLFELIHWTTQGTMRL